MSECLLLGEHRDGTRLPLLERFNGANGRYRQRVRVAVDALHRSTRATARAHWRDRRVCSAVKHRRSLATVPADRTRPRGPARTPRTRPAHALHRRPARAPRTRSTGAPRAANRYRVCQLGARFSVNAVAPSAASGEART